MTRRWIQHPVTHELIPREQYERPSIQTHAVHGDITPFISPIDKSLISDRGQLREHMRRHNVTNAADYPPEYLARKRREHSTEKNASIERKRTMYETWTKLEQG